MKVTLGPIEIDKVFISGFDVKPPQLKLYIRSLTSHYQGEVEFTIEESRQFVKEIRRYWNGE